MALVVSTAMDASSDEYSSEDIDGDEESSDSSSTVNIILRWSGRAIQSERA